MKYVPKMVQVHVVVRGTNNNIATTQEEPPLKGKNFCHRLHLERRFPPLAQGTLVRLAHPLNVREAAAVTHRHEAMVQHFDVRERQQRWHVVVLYVQSGCESHERAVAGGEQHARRTHVRSLCCSRWKFANAIRRITRNEGS